MITLPVWIDAWVYQCCGITRDVGANVSLELTLSGDVTATDDPESIEVHDDGAVSIVGTVAGPADDAENHTAGTIITVGAVQFAVTAETPATGRVRCHGTLRELRHGYPGGITEGRLTELRWRPAILVAVAEHEYEIVGYGPGERLASTEAQWQGDDTSWAFELTVLVA